MQKTCRNAWCKRAFAIDQRDLEWYQRLSPAIGGTTVHLPPPTLCPDCRLQRKMTFRNERRFTYRSCDRCRKRILSLYSEHAPFPVFCHECWWGDGWDGADYALDYDPEKSFFEQFEVLQSRVPRLCLANAKIENSEYCNHVAEVKNCYLIIGSVGTEDSYYGFRTMRSRNCVDTMWIDECELCYEAIDCFKCYDTRHALECRECTHCAFAQRCHGSVNLLFCVNVRKGDTMILNENVTKREFERMWAQIHHDPSVLHEYLKKYDALKRSLPVPNITARLHEDCTGNYIEQSRNAFHCFDVQKAENLTYGCDAFIIRDSCDVFSFYGPGELCYEAYAGGLGLFKALFIRDCLTGSDLLYSDYCFSSEHCFGCSGLKHAKYRIFNKAYEKEEYERLASAILADMSERGEWGEYFPMRISPFPYNESSAMDHYPLTKEEVTKRGLSWSDEMQLRPEASKVISGSVLPPSVDDVSDDILQTAIECEHTKKLFKIIKQELQFYRKMNIPLPRLHPEERHRKRLMLRTPRRLWSRTCANCKKEIETSYSPERPEIVFCEDCYQTSVYS